MREEKNRAENNADSAPAMPGRRTVNGSDQRGDATTNADGKAIESTVGDDNESDSRRIQVLTRAVDILQAVGRSSGDLSLGKIALEVGLPRSTVQRIVNALLAENLVSVGPGGRGYKIGAVVQQLAEAATQDVPQCLHPVLQNLSIATGETVDLAACRDLQMVFLDQVPGRQRLRAVSAVGEIFPMTVTANGKAVLASRGDDLALQVLRRERDAGVTDKSESALQRELAAVRADGFSLDIDDHTPGISAAGIGFRYRGLDYAISIPAPSHRFSSNEQTIISCLLDACYEIRRALPDVEFLRNP